MVRHGIDLDSPAIREFCSKWRINELCVFGSILTDNFRENSDVDFLADFGKDPDWDLCDHMDMEDELSVIVGREVDLITRYSVESSANRFRKEEILSTAEPVCATRQSTHRIPTCPGSLSFP